MHRASRHDTTSTAHSRAGSTLNAKEQATMFPNNFSMIALVNEARQAEMLQQAELARRVQLCAAPRRHSMASIATFRQRVGMALMQVGQRIHGAPIGGDPVAALPSALRTAR